MRRLILWGLLLSILCAPFVLAAAAFMPTPIAPPIAEPGAEDAHRVKRMAKELRDLTQAQSRGARFAFDQRDLDAALRMASRFAPGARGVGDVGPDGVALSLSVQIPQARWAGWINLDVVAPPSQNGVRFTKFQIGRISVPTAMVIPLGRWALNTLAGGGAGDLAAGAIGAVTVRGDEAALAFAIDGAERERLSQLLRASLRGAAFAADSQDIGRYLVMMSRAAQDGRIPEDGFAPTLRFAIDTAYERSATGGARRELEAALFAVGLACGTTALEAIIGAVPRGAPADGRCAGRMLDGRDDLRRHFAVSAVLTVLGERAGAFAVGEFKELLDSSRGGSGFSFDDILADRAGIKFAERFLTAPRKDWPALAARLKSDADILPEHRDLPSGLTEAAFIAAFEKLDSPDYAEMIAEIDARLREAAFFADDLAAQAAQQD